MRHRQRRQNEIENGVHRERKFVKTRNCIVPLHYYICFSCLVEITLKIRDWVTLDHVGSYHDYVYLIADVDFDVTTTLWTKVSVLI